MGVQALGGVLLAHHVGQQGGHVGGGLGGGPGPGLQPVDLAAAVQHRVHAFGGCLDVAQPFHLNGGQFVGVAQHVQHGQPHRGQGVFQLVQQHAHKAGGFRQLPLLGLQLQLGRFHVALQLPFGQQVQLVAPGQHHVLHDRRKQVHQQRWVQVQQRHLTHAQNRQDEHGQIHRLRRVGEAHHPLQAGVGNFHVPVHHRAQHRAVEQQVGVEHHGRAGLAVPDQPQLERQRKQNGRITPACPPRRLKRDGKPPVIQHTGKQVQAKPAGHPHVHALRGIRHDVFGKQAQVHQGVDHGDALKQGVQRPQPVACGGQPHQRHPHQHQHHAQVQAQAQQGVAFKVQRAAAGAHVHIQRVRALRAQPHVKHRGFAGRGVQGQAEQQGAPLFAGKRKLVALLPHGPHPLRAVGSPVAAVELYVVQVQRLNGGPQVALGGGWHRHPQPGGPGFVAP